MDLLGFLDPTTGVPTPIKMADNDIPSHFDPPNNMPVANGYGNLGNPGGGVGQGYEGGDRGAWLVEQSQKLEKQQALQQQKLLELEQVRTCIMYMYCI